MGFLELLQQRSLFNVLNALFVESFEQILRRLNINAVVVAVDDRELAVPFLFDICADKRRNVHVAREDRGVAVGAAKMGNKAEQLTLVELNGLRGSQILGNDDKGFVAAVKTGVGAGENVDDAGGDILNVGCARLHVLVVHRREGLGKVLAGCFNGVFC